MGEAVGLRGSVSELLGFTDQILKDSLFLKDFLGDVKNAPSEIKRLSREIDILSSTTQSTVKLIKEFQGSISSVIGAEFEQAFRQCVEAVQELEQKITEYPYKRIASLPNSRVLWYTAPAHERPPLRDTSLLRKLIFKNIFPKRNGIITS
jgi:hypothetical protein